MYDAVLFDLFGTLVDDTANPIDGAPARLAEMHGLRWAIVTSCGTRFATALIAQAGLPVPPVLVTADDVARNKPAPDGYLFAAKRLGIDPGRALVVEDSASGIAAGRQAGMDVIAVLRGRSPEFARAATFTVRSIAKLHLRENAGAIDVEFEP